jgi:3',5'-cyclic AMP phosphodiesterase CpdA
MQISVRGMAVLPLLLLLYSCSGEEKLQAPQYRIQSGQELSIFTTTDTHYLSGSLTDNGPAFNRFIAAGDGKQLGYSEEMLDALGYDIEIQRPDAVIISGDLTNNGELASHLDLAKHLNKIEEASGTQVYVIPGNHDIRNPWARQFKGQRQEPVASVTAGKFRKIYSAFGYDEALLQDKDSLSYLAAPSDDLWLLMLDTSQYSNNKELGHPQLDGRLSSTTLKWIDQCGKLAADNGAHIVAVMHHSLLDHSEFIREGFTINDNDQIIHALIQNGITAAFSGHIHIQDIRAYQRKDGKNIYDIADSALSVYPHQYGILKYTPRTQTLDYSTAKLNVELWAAASGTTDSKLLHFNSYSEESFHRLSSDRAYAELVNNKDYGRYTETELQAMARIVGRLNEIYFAGTAYTDIADVITSAGYRLWQDAPSSGLRSYVVGMAGRELKDNHHLQVTLPER